MNNEASEISTRKRKAEAYLIDGARITQRLCIGRKDTSLESSPSHRPPVHTVTGLLALLDFTSLSTHEQICARFDAIGEALLHHFHLRIAGPSAAGTMVYTDYEIIELEFYLYMPGCHEDPFTHGSDEQRQSGRWYFHRAPRRTTDAASNRSRTPMAAGGYRGGTRKGLDLTLGGPPDIGKASKFFPSASSSSKDPPRGGALLRSLRRISDNKVISGPSLLVDEILNTNKAKSIADLVASKWDGDTTALRSSALKDVASMYLCAASVTQDQLPTVYRSPRIGLDLSHASIPLPSTSVASTLAHPRAVFVSKRYRYLIYPHLLTSNGRGHTFLGIYQTITDANPDLDGPEILRCVARATGMKVDTASKYLEEYWNARESGDLAAFVGKKGKGAGSSPVTLLRMLGTLQGVRK